MTAREAYGLLGLAPAADPRQLRGAYLTAVKAAHPDKPGGDAEQLRLVIEAYEVLRLRPLLPVASPAKTRTRPRPASQHLEITPLEAAFGGVRSVPLEGSGEIAVRLPPGLRMGDKVGVSGVPMTVVVTSVDGAAVVGDHLCLTIQVDRAILAAGGDIEVATPTGPLSVHVTRQDGLRGLVQVLGQGLPARGRHGRGNLFIRLEAAASSRDEISSRSLFRRFVAAWAA